MIGGVTTVLALRSLRHRLPAFTATFLAVLLGTVVIGSFATLIETANGPVSDIDAETLTVMGAVVGGWGALIVLFSVASTVGITVGQRDGEIGLLRTIGATPRQARRLVRCETMAVCLVAASLGAVVASVAGRVLLAAIEAAGMIDHADYGGGVWSLAITVAGVMVVCLVAAGLAGRRATRGAPSITPGTTSSVRGMRRVQLWWRVAGSVLLIGDGVAMAIVTVTVTKHSDDPYAAMATSGSNSILVGVGLALLAPSLLRIGSVVARPVLRRGRAAAYLAGYNTSRRSNVLAGVLGPVIVLTAAAVGTLMLVGTDGRTRPAGFDDEAAMINLLNNVVVGMLCLFAAIMVVNAFVAVVADRRTELRRLWLLGATPSQVERSVVAEAGVVAGVGVCIGVVAALASIVPFGIARGEGVVPDGQLWLPPVLVIGVVALTLAAAFGSVRRVVRPHLASVG